MARVLVIGAGVTGCTVAYTLAGFDTDIILVEKASVIGGKVRSYGCKAVEKCQNCGVCLTTGLWEKVSGHKNIRVITNAVVTDITGDTGDYNAVIRDVSGNKNTGNTVKQFCGIDHIVVCTGFEKRSHSFSSHLHIEGTCGIMTGDQLEELMLSRTCTGLFENKPGFKNIPESIAFIQWILGTEGQAIVTNKGYISSR